MRVRTCEKYILSPSVRTAETSYGPAKIKCTEGFGIYREKPEYEAVAAIARIRGLPFRKVWEAIVVQTKQEWK